MGYRAVQWPLTPVWRSRRCLGQYSLTAKRRVHNALISVRPLVLAFGPFTVIRAMGTLTMRAQPVAPWSYHLSHSTAMPTQLNGLGPLLRQLIGARAPVLLTTPVVLRSTSKVKVIIGYTPLNLSGPVTLPNNVLNLLADRAAVLYGVRVELVLVRLGTPIMDASTLAQYLGSLLGGSAAKGYTFKACMRVLTKHLALAMRRFNAHAVDLQGVKVRVSGRLATEPTRPRQTVQEYSLGTFNGSKPLIQSGSHTVTNAKGSMTVKVWLGLKQA